MGGMPLRALAYERARVVVSRDGMWYELMIDG